MNVRSILIREVLDRMFHNSELPLKIKDFEFVFP